VIGVEGILTSQLGPDQVIANVGLEFEDELRTPDIERVIGHLESELRKEHPQLFRVFDRPHPDK
jgi:divalent metal cation (Fe/Co/Zn/Cd) transporter